MREVILRVDKETGITADLEGKGKLLKRASQTSLSLQYMTALEAIINLGLDKKLIDTSR